MSLTQLCISSSRSLVGRILINQPSWSDKLCPHVVVPVRNFGRKVKRRKTHPFRWWFKRRADSFKPELTPSNQEFLTEYMSHKFSSPLVANLEAYKDVAFTPSSRRVGVVARKIGPIPMWTNTGKRVIATMLQINDCHVIKCYPSEKFKDQVIFQDRWRYHGMACAIVGCEGAPIMKYSAAYAGLFNEAGLLPKRKITKMVVSDDALLPPGTPLYATHFRVGDYVDVFGKSVDRGFQGSIARWHFRGQKKGVSTKARRRGGSIARGRRLAGPNKGKKMPGHMGNERITMNGLEILRINTKLNIIWVKGQAVPGENGKWVYIFDSKIVDKQPSVKNPPPFPTYFPKEGEELPENIYHPKYHAFDAPTIIFEETEEEKRKIRQGAKLAKVRPRK